MDHFWSVVRFIVGCSGLVAVGMIAGNYEQWQVTHRWLAWLFVAIFAVVSAMVAGHGILTRVRVKVEY